MLLLSVMLPPLLSLLRSGTAVAAADHALWRCQDCLLTMSAERLAAAAADSGDRRQPCAATGQQQQPNGQRLRLHEAAKTGGSGQLDRSDLLLALWRRRRRW